MLACTTADVIDRLETIIRDAIHEGSRLGYFAALYNRVTIRVHEGIKRGEFADNERMERFDVMFANRYLDAYDHWHAGELPSRSWLQTFEAAARPDLTVLQHLALGMNAHIDLDLGVAAARTSPGEGLPALKTDFYQINSVLSSLVVLEEEQNAAIAPVIGKIGKLGRGLERKLIDFTMSSARTGAWHFASAIAHLPPRGQLTAIGARDLEVATAGHLILAREPITMLLGLGEHKDVRDNIEVLARGEFDLPPLGQASG